MNADKHVVSVDRGSSAARLALEIGKFMSKQSLRFLAVLLTVGIVVVLFAGLDGLPRDLKAQIAAERKSFTAAQSQLQSAQSGVSRDLATEADLFRALPSARNYPDRLNRASAS